MTLADFLLARIAEDEAWDWRPCHDCGTSKSRCDRAKESGAIKCCPDCRHPARELAEAQAKRRIVNASLIYHEGNEDPDPDDPDGGWALSLALLALAEIYADHPDYREEWKR